MNTSHEFLSDEINWVFIILTPAQYSHMKIVFGDKMYSKKTLIYYSNNLNLEQRLHKGPTLRLKFRHFHLFELIKRPLIGIIDYRRRLAEMRRYLERNDLRFKFSSSLNLVIGTDKDNFTQVFLNKLSGNKKIKVHIACVEEGLGFYIKENALDFCKSLLYKIITPILFGERIAYHKQLGTDPRIDDRYVRLPQYVPKYRGRSLKNLKIIERDKVQNQEKVRKGNVLIYSFPEKDFGMSEKEKIIILLNLISRIGDRKIFIKPHPRESTGCLKKIDNVFVLDSTMPGEHINYFDYENIFHFGSSIILDILAKRYPAYCVTTILIKNIKLDFFGATKKLDFKLLTRKQN